MSWALSFSTKSLGRLLAGLALLVSVKAAATERNSTSQVGEIEQRAASVSRELRAARNAGDPVRSRCASNKLSEIHAQLRLARSHAEALKTARGGDARVHRRALDVSHERAAEIAREARSCPADAALRRGGRARRVARR